MKAQTTACMEWDSMQEWDSFPMHFPRAWGKAEIQCWLTPASLSYLGKTEDTLNEGVRGVTFILYDLYLVI